MRENNKPLKVKLTISLDPDVEQKTRELADEDDRTFSAYINKILKENAKKEGKK